MNVEWIERNETLRSDKYILSINDMPEGVIGFIYLITYADGMKYIGKKNLYTEHTKKALKSGKPRKGAIDRVYKNTGKGFRQAFDILKQESNWKTYQGSHKEAKIRIPTTKRILQYAYTNLQLTYLEAKWQFKESVLERDDFINDNILGKFFRDVRTPLIASLSEDSL